MTQPPVTRSLLLEHFERLSEAPGAVEKLRRFVLELAVRGRLVEQDPREEPAEGLLKRIEKHKSDAGVRRSCAAPLERGVGPFSIPPTWRWVRLGDIVICRDGERIPVSKEERRTRAKVYDYYGASGVIDKIDGYLFDKPLLLVGEDGANLVNRSTPIAFMAQGKYWVNNHAHVLDGLSEKFLEYLALSVNAIDLKPFVTGTAQPKMNQAKMNGIPVALPPEGEQQRIVAKVDELMALCDHLEAAHTKREKRRDRLVTTSLRALTNGDDAGEPAGVQAREQSVRFCLNHLPRLTTRPEHIQQLRETILDLAVRGRLVPQDPDDEPAAQFLAKSTAKHSGRSRGLRRAEHPEHPFAVPVGWAWVRLGDLAQLVTSGSRDWAAYYSETGPIFVRMGNLSRGSYMLRMESVQRVRPPSSAEGRRTKLEEGDILISITGEAGLLGLIPPGFGEAYINQHTCLVRPLPELSSRYLPEVLRSPYAQGRLNQPNRGIKNSVRLTDVTDLPIPVPPPAEQHRIVAGVDRVMGLCDQVVAAQIGRKKLLDQLLALIVTAKSGCSP